MQAARVMGSRLLRCTRQVRAVHVMPVGRRTARVIPSPSVVASRVCATSNLFTRNIHSARVARGPEGTSDLPDLTIEDHLQIMSEHLDLLQRNNKFGQGLTKIKDESSESIVDRWQAAAAIYALSLAHCISPYGFTPDLNSLQHYQEQQEKLFSKSEHDGDIRAYNRERLLVLVDRAFGFSLPEESDIDVKQVRQIWGMLSMKMDSDEWVDATKKSVAEKSASFSGDEAEAAKFQVLQSSVLGLQHDVAGSFNLDGDEGFVKMQVAMMEYQTDDEIRYFAAMAYHKAFGKLGLKFPGAGQ